MAAVAGGVLGLAASQLRFLQAFTLLPWGVAALVVGYASRDTRAAIGNGASFGFVLGLLFMVGGYGGSDPVASKLPFFAVLGVVSAVAATVLSILGLGLRGRIRGNA